jgi:hypothetical protein
MGSMATETVPKGQAMRLGLGLLVALFGLCTIFALAVTAAEAWQERAQLRWPQVTAHVDRCELIRTSTGRRSKLYIRCRLNYAVGAEQHATIVYSVSVPSPEVWQYPPNQIAPFEVWVDAHPRGTPIVVRYDPARQTKVVLVSDYMPRGGPRTATNLKLLEFFAVGFLVFLTIARTTRARSALQNGNSSIPLHP